MAQVQNFETPFGSFSDDLRKKIDSGKITQKQIKDFHEFLSEVNRAFMNHRVVKDNEYCKWFNIGKELTKVDVRHMVEQFSVFSHLFLIAQLKKMINSSSIEQYRASKEILANEIGVIFHQKGSKKNEPNLMNEEEKDKMGDPEVVSTEGTVDGGTFRFGAGHYEWLFKIGVQLGVESWEQMGKRRHGTEGTLFFCDELERVYGSDDPNIGEGASFAVENWAAAGFWKDLISGLSYFKKHHSEELPNGLSLGFFTWHDRIEDQHAAHVMDELEEVYFEPWFNKEKFIQGGIEMLDGTMAFWEGLNKDRM